MPTNHKKVNKTKKVVRKSKKMSGGNRKVNRTRKVGRSRKMVGGSGTNHRRVFSNAIGLYMQQKEQNKKF